MIRKNLKSRKTSFLSKITLSALGVLSFLAISCTSPEIAGGGSDQPNEITGVVASVDTQPISSAKVLLYSKADFEERSSVHRTSQDFHAIDSTITGSDGKFKFSGIDIGAYSIKALYAPETHASQFVGYVDSIRISEESKTQDIQGLTLFFGGSIEGVIKSSELTLDHVELSGTPFTANIKADGSFKFENLPPGSYGLLSFYKDLSNNSGAALSMAGQVIPDSTVDLGTLNVTKDELLFEDFEHPDNRSISGYLYGGGWWYGVGTGLYTSAPRSPGIPVDESTLLLNSNHVFHAKWDFIDSIPNQNENYYVFGFNIGFGYDGYIDEGSPAELSFFDFSQVEKISFKAKGSGTFRLQLGTRAIREASASEVSHYGVEFTLDPTLEGLQDVVIDLSSMELGPINEGQLQDVKNLNWSDANKQVYAISFVVTNDAEIWLDDIRIIDYSINYFK